MAGAYKRASDRARGKSGKWTGWFLDRHGRRQTFAGTTDKGTTEELARHREREERLIRDGLIEPAAKARRLAAARHVDEHVAEYRAALVARGDTEKYADQVASELRRLMRSAMIESTGDLAPDRIAEALGRLRATRSARTHNSCLSSLKGFLRWLDDVDRIEAFPKAIRALKPLNVKNDRRYVRRVPAGDEWGRLLAAAEAGPTRLVRRGRGRHGEVVGELSGPDRAVLYRVAAATGLRVKELRSLTPESFVLGGDDPCIVVVGPAAKNRREARQPIRRDLAEELGPWVASREPGRPVFAIPHPAAGVLHADLRAAGIEPRDAGGRVLDFHSLRAFYVTSLIRRGVNPKVVQKLARHSNISLTLDIYTHAEDSELRDAIEGTTHGGSGGRVDGPRQPQADGGPPADRGGRGEAGRGGEGHPRQRDGGPDGG